MTKDELQRYLRAVGHELFRQKETVTVDLYGSAALMLGYDCWDCAHDVDVRWNALDEFVLGPAIKEVGVRFKHPDGAHWMNNAVADITSEQGAWSTDITFGGLIVRIPCADYLMARCVMALHSSAVQETGPYPYGKAAAQCVALAGSLQWDRKKIEEMVEPYFPHGVPKVCQEWLERLIDCTKVDDSNSEMLECH